MVYNRLQFSYPHAFFKKKSDGDIAIASVTLSPPKPLGEIGPNLACELFT